VRLLSALSDLKLEGRRGGTKEGDYEERRKLRKFGAVKDDDEEIIYEPFTKIYRNKKPHDKKIISDCLMGHFTFSYLEDSIREKLLEEFKFCKVDEGNYLIRQGDNATCFFILHEGKMSVEIDGELKKRLSPADGGFGELALLFNAPRSASIRAETNCFLWYIDRKTFKKAVEEVISGTYNENKAFIDKCSLLGELTNGQRQALADISMSQYYEKNSKICKEGELASSFYILKSGRIRRLREGETVGYVNKGEIFEHQTALNE
jgi:cGMP-dependent protein kinase 1